MLYLPTLFISLRWLDIADILLVAVLLYLLYNIVKGTVAINIFLGILLFYIVFTVVKALEMELLSNILGKFIDVGVIVLIIVFQQELRKFLLIIGTSEFLKKFRISKKLFDFSWQEAHEKTDIESIVVACSKMAESRTGALIVLTRTSDLNFYESTGDLLNSKISPNIIESIFFKNSPLHDGAMIISGNKIKAARCVLPVTENMNFPSHLGMRHRAAVGITENSDALAIIVSEQTGEISFAKGGKLENNIDAERLALLLNKELSQAG